MAARTSDELHVLLADLPSGDHLERAAASAEARMVVLLGNLDRSGRWRLAERTRLMVACGACTLDLRRATVSAPLTVLQVQVVVGRLDIIVPIGVDVDVAVMSVLANKRLCLSGPMPSGAPPRILVRGSVVAGELHVEDRAAVIDVLR